MGVGHQSSRQHRREAVPEVISADLRSGVRVVKALTRFHFAGAHRRTFSRAAARDRRRSAPWGWHENVIGIGMSWKCVNGKMLEDACCVTFYVLRKEPKRRLLSKQRIPSTLEIDSVSASVHTDVVA